MPTRTANAHWEGSLAAGKGTVSLDSSGAGSFDVSWPARAEQPGGLTSPEELIAAAHASCFSMALSSGLSKAGTPPRTLDTRAEVTLEVGTGITGIQLTVRGSVDGIDEATFVAAAEQAKENCPVSKALTGTTIRLEASLG
ncbi:MAG TPA: OsmC family protein [Mycobacteriales bacterium]|nr:OsmC family protein [Mycobacteriales bacterium]